MQISPSVLDLDIDCDLESQIHRVMSSGQPMGSYALRDFLPRFSCRGPFLELAEQTPELMHDRTFLADVMVVVCERHALRDFWLR